MIRMFESNKEVTDYCNANGVFILHARTEERRGLYVKTGKDLLECRKLNMKESVFVKKLEVLYLSPFEPFNYEAVPSIKDHDVNMYLQRENQIADRKQIKKDVESRKHKTDNGQLVKCSSEKSNPDGYYIFVNGELEAISPNLVDVSKAYEYSGYKSDLRRILNDDYRNAYEDRHSEATATWVKLKKIA